MYYEIIHALWQQDFIALADPSVIWVVCPVLFTHPCFWKMDCCPPHFSSPVRQPRCLACRARWDRQRRDGLPHTS